jgi:hypothetical protein
MLSAGAAQAQPFSGYMLLDGQNTDYIQIPHSAALNPTGAITIEGWVQLDSIACVSLFGKNYTTAYWVGTCNDLRSYLRGNGSSFDGGTVPTGVWTHVAVTSDGTTRRHYLNGVLTGTFAEGGALTTNTDAVRIGSDVAWEFAPTGGLDEFRLWNVVRTQGQIQSTMNTSITSPMAGLVSVWSLDTDGSDAVGTNDGTVVGSPVFVAPVPSLPVVATLLLLMLLLATGVRGLTRARA